MNFYQDRDGVIRIKPPYWSQPVLLNHIIDPILITNMSDSSNYDNFLTRVIVTGGLDQAFQTGTNSDIAQKLWTPIGCYMSNGAWSNAQSVEGFEMGYAPLGASTGEGTGGEEGVMGGEYNGNGNTQVSDLLKYDTATRINTITKIAASFYNESKIIPSITGAQSFTEAGAGTSTVAKQANNLFGIQAGSWKNDPTKEVYQGKTTAYRKYKSVEACVYDRVCNVLQQSNYTKYGLRGETDPAKALMAMKKGGYWTDGDDAASGGSYANLVLKTIKKYDLQRRYDEPCIKGTFSSGDSSGGSSSSSSSTTSSLSLQSDVENILDDNAFNYETVVNNSGYPKKRNDGTLIVGEGNSSKLEKLKGYGIWFPDIKTGIRAHIQHLSGLTRGKLISDNKCVDPSFCEDNIFINVVSDFDKIKNRNKLYPKKIFQCLLSIFDFCEEDVNVNLALSTPLTSYNKEKLRNYFSLLSQGKPIYINGNMTIQEFINVYIEEAQQENVSVYVALAQMIVDTGFLRWGAGQAYQQNNFAKLGAGDSKEIIMTASDWY